MLDKLAAKIINSKSIILTTHRQCDGDGLGAQLGLYHALKKMKKNVRVVNVDALPRKYFFLNGTEDIEIFEGEHRPIEDCDLCLVFDTNDKRLLSPLYEKIEATKCEIIFIDHHPVLNKGPKPTEGSVIDTFAASTGELAFNLIRELSIDLDTHIAEAIYTSIVFDTQIFRYVRNSANSHLIAAELLPFIKNPGRIHQNLFGNFTTQKIAFLSKVLGNIEYFADSKIAILHIDVQELESHGMDLDDSRDLVDMIMNIDTLEAAVLFREDAPGEYKLSFRSKGTLEVLDLSEKLGGGGHRFSSGAFLKGDFSAIKGQIVDELTKHL